MKDGSLNNVQVKIMDETLILNSVESVEHIRAIADYVNIKAEELLKESKGALIGHSIKQLLVIINIADDLFKEKEKVRELELALGKARKEMSEYIEAFDHANNKS